MNSFCRLLPLIILTHGIGCFLQAQELIAVELKGSRSLEELQETYGPFTQYGVNLYKILYTTTGIEGQKDTASGLVVLPEIEVGDWPLVVYLHGTINLRDSIPSNLSPEAQIPTVYSGVGSIALAPDLLGYGASEGFHPYLHAASEASSALDMMLAAQAMLAAREITTDGRLLIAGYSQGGHSAAALHRLLESQYPEQFPVTGGAFMSGPYSLSGVMKDEILGDEQYFFPAFVVNVLLSYHMIYGIYEELSMLFKEPYLAWAELFYSGLIEQRDLNEGLIDALNETEGGVFPKLMLQDSVLQNLEANPNHPITRALMANDVDDWAPQAPVQLIYCSGDDRVPYENSLAAEAAMTAAGAPAVTTLDVGPMLDHEACVEPAALASLLFFGQLTPVEDIAGQDSSLRIYPNPLRRDLFVEGISGSFHFGLYDAGGRLVYSTLGTGAGPLSLPILNPGLYVARINAREGNWSLKLVVGN